MASYTVQEGGQYRVWCTVIVALGKLMVSLSCFLCFLIFQMVTIVLTSQVCCKVKMTQNSQRV